MTRQSLELDHGQEPAQHEARRAGPVQEAGRGLGELRCGWGQGKRKYCTDLNLFLTAE